MAQEDYVISNADGATVRADINSHLAAIVSNNSGATAPSSTFAFQFWADTSAGLLKIRNSANSAWITVGSLSDAFLGRAASGANSDITSLTGLTTDLSVSQGGTGAGTFTANGILYGNGTSALGVTAAGTSGQVLTSNGSGSAPTFQDAGAGGGKVLQVVQASTSTQAESTSSTYADTNLSASITPSATSSKVLVLVSQSLTSAGGAAGGEVAILRGSTTIEEFSQLSNVENQMTNHYLPYLDSPSTTSATTYKTQFKRIDQSGTLQAQRNDATGNATSIITLMEIGA